MTEYRTSGSTDRRARARAYESAALRELVQEVGELRRENESRESRDSFSRERRSAQAPPRDEQARAPRGPQAQSWAAPAQPWDRQAAAGGRRDSRARARRPPRPRRPARPRRPPRLRRRSRRRLMLPAGAAALVLVLVISGALGGSRSFALPSRASLGGLSTGQRIVAIARSQVGYSADPAHSYCNKFSAYWNVGTPSCPGAESAEEWCADFAAWAWRQAGVPFSYGFGAGELNAAAASFYEWGVAHGTWHSAYSGYHAAPGDVAVYGLSLGSAASAAHVAIVTGDPRGQDGPDVINGDGDHTGFSVVETGTDQLRADAGHGQDAPLAGYVSP